jgi:5'-methylthioadenosine phosphorylase
VAASASLEVMRANVDTAREALRHLARALPEERAPSPIDRALDGAIVTATEHWDVRAVARLDAILGRYLRATQAD